LGVLVDRVTQDQPFRDLVIRESLCHETQHLDLARGQLV
jgi:hypothetical protein